MSVALAPNREATRLAVLEAAGRVFRRYGYRKAAVDDIAREAGVSRATVYLYFAGKEEIALSWIEMQSGKHVDDLRAIASSSGTPEYRLRRVLLERILRPFERVREYPESLEDLFAGLRSAVLEIKDRLLDEIGQILAGLIEEGISRGEFVPVDPLDCGRTMALATNALTPLNLSPRLLERNDEMERRTSALVDLLIRAVKKQ